MRWGNITAKLYMLSQQGHPRECLFTFPTLVLLNIRMSLHVSPQVGPVCKRAATMTACKWTLTSVGPYMALKEPGTAKRFPTYPALAGESVSTNVHFQCSQTHIVFVTVLAWELSGRLWDRIDGLLLAWFTTVVVINTGVVRRFNSSMIIDDAVAIPLAVIVLFLSQMVAAVTRSIVVALLEIT